MKPQSRTIKKWVIGIGILLILPLLLVSLAYHYWNQFAQTYQIKIASFQYDFPSHLQLEGIQVAAPEGIRADIKTLAIDWTWKSLLHGKLVVNQLDIRSGTVSLSEDNTLTSKEAPEEENPNESVDEAGFFPLDLHHASIHDVDIHIASKSDSFLIEIPVLLASNIQVRDTILADRVTLSQGLVKYTYLGPDADTAAISLENFPKFSINHIEVKNSFVQIAQAEQSYVLSQLNLKINGWENTDLLGFKVQNLAFIFQDTLQMDIILDGEVANNLDTKLQNLFLKFPGLALHVDEVSLVNRNGLQGAVQLSASAMSMGLLKQIYPDIMVAMDPAIPNDSLIAFNGLIEFNQDQLKLSSISLKLLKETYASISGKINWAKENTEFEMLIDRLHTNREDLYAFLTEESYNEFFYWPTNVNGNVSLKGNTNFYDIRGNLTSNEGNTKLQSVISLDLANNLFYSIDLESDSMLVNRLIDYLPLEVPYGQLNLSIAGTLNNNPATDTFRMDVTSKRISVENHLLEDLSLTYFFNNQYDSIWTTLQDRFFKGNFKGAYYEDDTAQVAFHGAVQELSTALLSPEIPQRTIRTAYTGSYDWSGDDFYQITVATHETSVFSDSLNQVPIPDSYMVYNHQDDSLVMDLFSEEQHIAHLAATDAIYNLSTDSADWLAALPNTDFFLTLSADTTTVYQITGYQAGLNIEEFQFQKTNKNWTVQLDAPTLNYGEFNIYALQLNLEKSEESGTGVLSIASINNPFLPLDSFYLDISKLEDVYQLDVNTNLAIIDKQLSFGLQMLSSNENYIIRMDDQQPLLIADNYWDVNENLGIYFDKNFTLQSGDLALEKESNQLELNTLEDGSLQFRADSLALSSLASVVDSTLQLDGLLNASLLYNPTSANLSWQGHIDDIIAKGISVGNLSAQGGVINEKLTANLELVREHTNATFAVHSQDNAYSYTAALNNFDLEILETMPFIPWPEDLNLTGQLNGEVIGIIDSTLSSSGFLAFSQTQISMADVSTFFQVPDDTIYLADDKINLHDFSIYDQAQHPLTLSGSVTWYPTPSANIHMVSDQFGILNDLNKNAMIRGNLALASNLNVQGSMDDMTVDGTLKVLSGGFVAYDYQGNINVIDASKTVSFVEFDKLEKEHEVLRSRKTKDPLNWNVNLEVDNSTFEVVLNKVSQEFVRVVGGGQIRLRSGEEHLPLIYGSLEATSGRALIFPPIIPTLDLDIEKTSISWQGDPLDPVISFRGVETIKATPNGLPSFAERTDLVNFQAVVALDDADLNNISPIFDIRSLDGQVNTYLQSLGGEIRQQYAIDLLVFGTVAEKSAAGASETLQPFVSKLNEIASRNLKNTDLSFGVVNTTYQSESGNTGTQTNLNYKISRGLFQNRMFISLGGDVGLATASAYAPPSHLIGNMELGYIIKQDPSISLIGARKHVFEGVIDGDVVRSSLGIKFRKSYPSLQSIFRKKRNDSTDK